MQHNNNRVTYEARLNLNATNTRPAQAHINMKDEKHVSIL